MKKLPFVPLFFALFGFFSGFLIFAENDKHEEVDFLLFLPNSGNLFVNEEQAMIQLDNLAGYLMDRNLIPGQINVYGYAAAVVNDIEPINLSRDRALFVINELQKRGIPKDLFSDPVGYGSVDLWGSNTNEGDRGLNRRVRIVLDGNLLTPGTLKPADSGIETSNMDNEEALTYTNSAGESRSKFPWRSLILLLALLAAAIFLLSKIRRKAKKPAAPEGRGIKPSPRIAASVATSVTVVNLEEEIRRRAYELYERRNGQDEDAAGDWHRAADETSDRYAAAGYLVYTEDGCWWARRSAG